MTVNKSKKQRRFFRKSLVIPAEHGSWSWLLVPFFVGAGVAATSGPGQTWLPVWLTLLGGLSGFLMRQPATAWLRIRQGRGRRSDHSLAAGWMLGFAAAALLALVGLLLLGRIILLWLLLPLAAILLIYLAVAHIHRAGVRSLWMEMAGAAGLAAMAPAAYAAAGGRLDEQAWLLWVLLAVQNMLGVLYVRQRLADTHRRSGSRVFLVTGHLISLLMLVLIALLTSLPWLTLLPFVGFFVRALWASVHPRPVHNIKKFGFTEVGIELVSGLWIIGVYLLL